MKVNGNEIRQGNIIEHQGRLWRAVKVHHVQMGNWRSYLQIELKDIRDGTKLNERFRTSDVVERAQLDEREYQYLYHEGDLYTFMDKESYEQITLSQEAIGDGAAFLKDDMTVKILSHDGTPLSVALPETVVMEVVEADPVVRGQTASSSYKPAKLENGVRILVPPHIAAGLVLVREAGGYVSEIEGGIDMLESGSTLAANSYLHEPLGRLLRAASKPRA